MNLRYTYKGNKYNSHVKIINLIKPNSKILDIGCAQGYLAKELLKKNCKIIGIDNDKNALKIANKYCKKTFFFDLDNYNLKLKEKFDVIILGDILEHLKNPLLLLKKIKRNIKEKGYIIASTVNIANIYIRFNLLFGKFDYTEKGILDKTHLRFFTLKTFKQLITDAGFKVKKIETTPIPLTMIFPVFKKYPLRIIYDFLNIISLLWKKMFTFQFIIVAVPS